MLVFCKLQDYKRFHKMIWDSFINGGPVLRALTKRYHHSEVKIPFIYFRKFESEYMIYKRIFVSYLISLLI